MSLPNNLATLVDELGALKAQISVLTEREKALKAMLFESGYAEIDGEHYRATVSWSERATLDGDAVRALLSDELIRQCTKVSEVKAVRVVARKRAVA